MQRRKRKVLRRIFGTLRKQTHETLDLTAKQNKRFVAATVSNVTNGANLLHSWQELLALKARMLLEHICNVPHLDEENFGRRDQDRQSIRGFGDIDVLASWHVGAPSSRGVEKVRSRRLGVSR
jgi:hypothetical protein